MTVCKVLSRRASAQAVIKTAGLAATVLVGTVAGSMAPAVNASASAKTGAWASTKKTAAVADAEVLSSRTTKASLGPTGGEIQVKGTVKHAQTCQLKLLWVPAVSVVYSHNASPTCHGGNYSANVIVGPNTSGLARTVALQLVARNTKSKATSTMYVVESPAAPKTTTTTTTTVPSTTAPTAPATTTTLPTTTTTIASGVPSVTPMTTTSPVDDESSANWSGYVAYGNFTAASGTFTVPSISGPNENYSTSEWVGLDGANDDNLVQAGVAENVARNGSIQINAWWEILPSPETIIPTVTVSAGDTVTVTIWQVSGTTWDIYLVDDTNGEHFSTTQSYAGTGDSAEWEVEAPTNASNNQITNLAPYTPPVTFSTLGATGTVTGLEQDTLVQNDTAVSTPSAITSSGFTVTNTDTPYTP